MLPTTLSAPRRVAPLRSALQVLAATALLSACSVTSERSVSVERTVDTAATAGPVSLDVDTRNGAVAIRTDPGVDRVSIQAKMRAGGSSRQAADERVAAMDVDVRSEPGGVLRIRPVLPGSTWRSNDSVSFDIVVPALGAADVETSNGSVRIDGATERSQVVTGNGSVVAANCRGGLEIGTSNASVTVRGSEGDLSVATSNGSVKIDGHQGRLDVGTSNGRIQLKLPPGTSSPFDLRTSNGSIGIDLTSDWSGIVAASTSNGRVRVDRDGRGAEKRGRSSKVELGGGGARSTARSSNGSISINVRRVAL